jgi:hypothetical protein
MLITAQIDLAEGDEPIPGDNFAISSKEDGSMVGVLDDGHTFRFTSPSKAERTYQREDRSLTVVAFDLDLADFTEDDLRLIGTLTYAP